MGKQLVRFSALFFCGVAMIPAVAHLCELPNKLSLPREEYFVVQQIYRGWWLFAVAVVGALAATAALAWQWRRARRPFWLVAAAALCIASTQVVFWSFTQPANVATSHWTEQPSNWRELRRHWEYSHAASAVLNLAAFVLVGLALVASGRPERLSAAHQD